MFIKGKRVYNSPDIATIRNYCAEQLATMWDSVLRFENPQRYYVDLSEKLWNIKHSLLSEKGKN